MSEIAREAEVCDHCGTDERTLGQLTRRAEAAEREAERLRRLREQVRNVPWRHVHRMSEEAQIMRVMRRVKVEEMEVRDA